MQVLSTYTDSNHFDETANVSCSTIAILLRLAFSRPFPRLEPPLGAAARNMTTAPRHVAPFWILSGIALRESQQDTAS